MPAARVPRDRVPAGMQYIVFDKQGRQLRVIEPALATEMAVDCVQIACPPALKAIAKASGKKIRCWR